MATAAAIPEEQYDRIRVIAREFGIGEREISPAPRQGNVNLTILLGPELVLRLPRKRKLEQRLAKEAEVIPFVVDRGIPTAELISFDASHSVVDLAYIVLQRLHGRTIDDLPSIAEGGDRMFGSLCEILSGLHAVRRGAESPLREVMTAEFGCESLLDEVTEAGEIGSQQAVWLRGWFRRLETLGARTSEAVLLHGDVMPSNLILNDSGEVTAVIDWGSACWGEAARDLAGLRTTALPRMAEFYRKAAGGTGTGLEAGLLWYQLFFALARLGGRTSTSEARNWSAPREARLLELLRFLTAEVPDRWRTLLPRD